MVSSTGVLPDLSGYTRSVYEREYALITPESQVYTPVSGSSNSLCAFLITPAMGSHFSMCLAKMTSLQPFSKGVERLAKCHYTVADSCACHFDNGVTVAVVVSAVFVQSDGYAYLPPDSIHETRSKEPSMLLVFECRYTIEGSVRPELLLGMTHRQPLLDTPGKVFALRKLLTTSNAYDFNVHVMEFQPGEYLNEKVRYAALGRIRSRYILYKDVNRDPLFHPH
ncbi:hypothetical protein R1flu_026326 [Riccia fluitans]|uniref:Uncharacterized protein n=1 Tax=Riccia fluitans TaxID=41844 RepID=A0ABD1XJP4_9MARC